MLRKACSNSAFFVLNSIARGLMDSTSFSASDDLALFDKVYLVHKHNIGKLDLLPEEAAVHARLVQLREFRHIHDADDADSA